MKRILFVAIGILLLAFPAQVRAEEPGGLQVLIYTRNGEGYVHDNIEASVAALEKICDKLGIESHATDDPAVFLSPGFASFDAVIFSNSNNEAFTSEAQRQAFRRFIASGKGFMGVHSANASERDWPWFREMVGGKFLRHPPLQKFDIRVIDNEHLSTRHLPAVWEWEDECYYSDHLNPGIRVLLAADLTTIRDKEKEVYPGKVFGDLFPLAWYHEFEGSRVFYTALGHKIGYYEDENFVKHLEGGLRWVLGGNME